jgi:transcription-repair coupling factor (superfamily II helicase)
MATTEDIATALRELDVVRAAAALTPKARAQGIEIVGPWGSAKALVAVQLARAAGASLLYLTAGRIESESAMDDLCAFAGADECAVLPAWEVLPTDAMQPADDIVAERMTALQHMANALEDGVPIYASVSVRSFLQPVVRRDTLTGETVHIKVGKEYDLEAIVERLVDMGYERELMVEQRGELSVRGGIFDVFPISGELPFRIEFFGDEVESIRRFEPETQRSVDTLERVSILPRSEKDLLRDQSKGGASLTPLTEYFGENTLLIIDEPMAVRQEAERLLEQFPDTPYMMPWDEAMRHELESIELAQVAYAKEAGKKRLTTSMRSMSSWSGQTDGFWEQLERWDLDGYAVRLYCNNTGERRRLVEMLEERGYRLDGGALDLEIAIGALRDGFDSPKDRLAVLSEREMFGRKYIKRTRRRFSAGATITTFSDLRAGDYIVHALHGIGRYLGLKRFNGKAADFLGVQYKSGDIMYVPVTHVDLIQKYVGGDGVVPKMDKIGGETWARAKKKVKKSVLDMTSELVRLYAKRETLQGHAFTLDAHWQGEFEDSFEYDETPDQLRAIAEIKRDMESAKPMERLLCGDVGYGKTEVAMRAAFKCVMDGMQVAVLAPTTILTEQHYNTFRERFADYPVKIEMLSRFRTAKQQRETIDRLKSGEVDIAIGTHRLVSKDVGFKNLGLAILDEEQRFGVRQKERLKQLRNNVDVLTLSATPIPRTMHMSLLGVRDMSVINTAPNDRLPIHTCIEVFDEQLVAEAIGRELAREGQVFYLHNRIQTIPRVASMIQRLVPHARIAIGHGQMGEHALEEVMSGFIRNDIDVLVCTTIIGSGLDIPNANTMIVDRADNFGLSELYQLRGRIGRYKHRAFAYLLVPGDRALTEIAQKRLKALEEFSTLGAGFRIAMRDLEIRGCGNLLGPQQSGSISTVGYDTYTQLIAETVGEMRGDPVKTLNLPQFDVPVDGFIPDSYVTSEPQKLTLYKRISGIRSTSEVAEFIEELTDRFGKPPKPVLRLLAVMRVRAKAAEVGATQITGGGSAVVVVFQNGHFLSEKNRPRLMERFGSRLETRWKGAPALSYAVGEGGDAVAECERLLDALLDL